jgi:hypothetical protein
LKRWGASDVEKAGGTHPSERRRSKMLKASVGWSEVADAYKAGKESAEKALAELGGKAGLAVAFCTVHYDEANFVKGIRDVLGDVPLMGSTSFSGILTPGSFLHKESGVGGVMLLASPEMEFGVGASEIGDDPRAAGQEAVRAAIAQAGKSESGTDAPWLRSAAARRWRSMPSGGG